MSTGKLKQYFKVLGSSQKMQFLYVAKYFIPTG